MSGERPRRLSAEEVRDRLARCPGWSLDAGKLHRSFRFDDFSEAFGFMVRSALVAEVLNHHPEWHNVWNRVDVHLTTHDVGGVTRLDFELAEAMSRLAG